MPSFSYTGVANPYSSTPPSVESALQALCRSRNNGSPSPAAIQGLQERIAVGTSSPSTTAAVKWNMELAQSLTTYVLNLWAPLISKEKDDTDIPDGHIAALFFLTTCMEQWQDDILYACLIHQHRTDGSSSSSTSKHTESSKQVENLLGLWTLLTKKDPPVYLIAMCGFATACRALDRLQHWTSLDPNNPDAAWWLSESDAQYLTPLVIRCLSR